jgi:hypothetical protein
MAFSLVISIRFYPFNPFDPFNPYFLLLRARRAAVVGVVHGRAIQASTI